MRRPIVAGNWKMNTTLGEAEQLARALGQPLHQLSAVETVLCPPFISLATVRDAVAGLAVAVGAQNCHFEAKGAFTGEISPAMLADLGCRYVILGHSERRQHFGETDAVIQRKVRAALEHGLIPIVCVGENLAQNEAGETEAVVGRQVEAALDGLAGEQVAGLIVAYEPVWAIGTGRPATAEQANGTIGFIRRTVATTSGEAPAAALRIQYGGSVTPANASELFAQSEIDGALVGGASLKAEDFIAICHAASRLAAGGAPSS
ncbi:MAG TPA: triose-phosphate isomerase [Chloroflexota bacterium]|nr:triose-phosphate isomerase [Chloroflexota bacterium]